MRSPIRERSADLGNAPDSAGCEILDGL